MAMLGPRSTGTMTQQHEQKQKLKQEQRELLQQQRKLQPRQLYQSYLRPRLPLLLLSLLLLLCLLPPSEASAQCDDVTEAFVRLYMEAVKTDECLQQAVDRFNRFVVATAMVCFSVSLLTGATLVVCILYPLFRARTASPIEDGEGDASNQRDPTLCVSCGACSCLLASLAISMPLALRGVAWASFFNALCNCFNGCLSEEAKVCWRENSDITGQDHVGILVLPITFGSLAFILALVLCLLNALDCSRSDSHCRDPGATNGPTVVMGSPAQAELS